MAILIIGGFHHKNRAGLERILNYLAFPFKQDGCRTLANRILVQPRPVNLAGESVLGLHGVLVPTGHADMGELLGCDRAENPILAD